MEREQTTIRARWCSFRYYLGIAAFVLWMLAIFFQSSRSSVSGRKLK